MNFAAGLVPNEVIIGSRISMNVAPAGLDPLEYLPRLEALRTLLGNLALPSAAARSVAPLEESLAEAMRLLHLEDPGHRTPGPVLTELELLWARAAGDPGLGRQLRALVEASLPWLDNDGFGVVVSALVDRLTANLDSKRLNIDSWSLVRILGAVVREARLRHLTVEALSSFRPAVLALARVWSTGTLGEPDGATLEAERFAWELKAQSALARAGMVELLERLAELEPPGSAASAACLLAARNILGW